MEAELAELATKGATALVGLMATEAWALVKPRFAALFGRNREEEVSQELDEIQEEIVEDPESGEGQTSQWQRRLRIALKNNPEAVAELKAILDEFSPKLPQQEAGSTYIHNTISGGNNGDVIQAGIIHKMKH